MNALREPNWCWQMILGLYIRSPLASVAVHLRMKAPVLFLFLRWSIKYQTASRVPCCIQRSWRACILGLILLERVSSYKTDSRMSGVLARSGL